MPPSSPRQGGRVRRILFLAIVAVTVGGAWALYSLGSFLHREDPLQRADVIFVLAGTRMERPLEAADLFLEGWAPLVALSEDMPDGGMIALEARGIHIASDAEMARDTMIRLGVPPTAITILPETHDSTAHEAYTLRQLAAARGWRRLIVVTSKYHTRRAAFALRRELNGSGVEVVMRGSRYDPADPAHWWRTRAGVRWASTEAQKLIAYALGLGM